MEEEPGDAFLDGADPDFIFTGREWIAGLREGSEDGGEADGGAWSEGIGQGSSSLQRRVRRSHGLAACKGNQRMPSWTAAGVWPISQGVGQVWSPVLVTVRRREAMVPRTIGWG